MVCYRVTLLINLKYRIESRHGPTPAGAELRRRTQLLAVKVYIKVLKYEVEAVTPGVRNNFGTRFEAHSTKYMIL